MGGRLVAAWAVISLAVLASCQGPSGGRTGGEPAVMDNGKTRDSDVSLTIYSSADPRGFDPAIFQGSTGSLFGQGYTDYNNSREGAFPGFAVVQDRRMLALKSGENTVQMTDVAAAIDPTTVGFVSETAPDTTTVLEQNFKFDVVSSGKLLDKYRGRPISITLGSRASGETRSVEGKLLSVDVGAIVLETADRQHPIQIINLGDQVSAIQLTDLPAGLLVKPTLELKVVAEKAGNHQTRITYQTDNVTWRADYRLVLSADEKTGDLGAWVTLVNQSGASYPQARLKLIAGDVRRFVPQSSSGAGGLFGGAGGAAATGTGFVEKEFFEYHLYTLERRTDVPDNASKQVDLFAPRRGVAVVKTLVYDRLGHTSNWSDIDVVRGNPGLFGDSDHSAVFNSKVDIYLALKNSKESGLGIPLPAGRVRVYKADPADGTPEFLGEDAIDHTPKDEEVFVRIGEAFDVVGETTLQKEEKRDGRWWPRTQTFETSIRNHKGTACHVMIRDHFVFGPGKVSESTDKVEVHDAKTFAIPVDVPANGSKKVVYTVQYAP